MIRNIFYNTSFLATLTTLLLFLTQIEQASEQDTFMGRDSRGVIVIWLEILIVLAFTVTLILNILVIRKYGISILGQPFIYILIGLIFMILTRIFIVLFNFSYFDITDTTLQFGWHVMFYSGMMCFLMAINNFKRKRRDIEINTLERTNIVILIGIGLITLMVFVFAHPLDDWLNSWFLNSFLDNIGILHFIAFVMAGYLAFDLFRINTSSTDTDLGKLISSIIPAFLAFLTLMSLNHFWELITESWGILLLDDSIIETGEQVFWLPGFLLTSYGYWKVLGIGQSITEDVDGEQSIAYDIQDNSLMANVLDILQHHIGSDAQSIAFQSCTKIGIKMKDFKKEQLEEFGNEVQSLTQNLIGDFPSRFLNQAIQRIK